jgi:hypothetical protein
MLPWSRLAALIRERFLLAWVAGALVWLAWLGSLAWGGWAHDARGKRIGADHVQYYVVGQLVNEGTPELVYDEKTMAPRQKAIGGDAWTGWLPFRYPPFFALCFAPTSRLPYEASWFAWTVVGLILLVVSGRLLEVPWRAWLGWSLCFFPVFAAVSMGQNGLISLAILSAAAVLWLRDRPLAAGLVAGLLAFKPFMAVGLGLLWILDCRRSWPALLGLTITTVCLLLAGWLAIPGAYRAFWDELGTNLTSSDPNVWPTLVSSQGFWEMLLGPAREHLARILSLATSLAGLVVFVVLWWRLRRHRAIALAVAILLTPWLTPYMQIYDWSLLLIPAALLWRVVPQERDRWTVLIALGLAAAVIAGPFVRLQMLFLPVGLQPGLPALIAIVFLLPRMKPEAEASESKPEAQARGAEG